MQRHPSGVWISLAIFNGRDGHKQTFGDDLRNLIARFKDLEQFILVIDGQKAEFNGADEFIEPTDRCDDHFYTAQPPTEAVLDL